jgi:hypothetical protein
MSLYWAALKDFGAKANAKAIRVSLRFVERECCGTAPLLPVYNSQIQSGVVLAQNVGKSGAVPWLGRGRLNCTHEQWWEVSKGWV